VQLIDWYRARWEIEMYFDVLKNGCKVESLQLKTMPRLELALALYMVVAWRINRLMRLGRACPELPADLLFETEEWQAAYLLHDKPVPKTPPPLQEVVRLVASLSGFLGRKGDGEPGARTIWDGLEQIAVCVARYEVRGRSTQPGRTCVERWWARAPAVRAVEHVSWGAGGR